MIQDCFVGLWYEAKMLFTALNKLAQKYILLKILNVKY